MILAAATRFWVAMAARAAAFWAFMAASPFLMAIAWALVIAAIVGGVYLIYQHFGSIRAAWDALCSGCVSAWRA
ncbi:hypothetical protein GII61_23990, partial [Escherichia coli]|uniref:hypothetical protein n=1 Tax=Escherichia coli TaxID=562 RepID=UPI0012999919